MRPLLKSQWPKLRKCLLERNGLDCAGCGVTVPVSSKLHAHEEWKYLTDAQHPTALLITVTLVCWHCHHVEHWGVTKSLVAQGQLTKMALDDTIAHFCRLNNATCDDFLLHEVEATKEWEQLSKLDWQIDYGPFLGWVAATFNRDPLNDRDWSEEIERRWGNQVPPTMEELAQSLVPHR